MKINVEKRLHELAQWYENEARNLRERSASPSMPELADRHHYTAEIMRLAQVGLSIKTNKIIVLEESLRNLLGVMPNFPEDARTIVGMEDRYNAAITNAKMTLGEKK